MATPDSITIPLTQGYSTLISSEDADLALLKWHAGITARERPYAKRSHPTTLIHIVIMERMINRKLVKGEKVDHADGDSLNNRRDNLRLANNGQNARNSRIRIDSTTGYKGVTARGKRFIAQIQGDGQKIHLGMFDTPEEAHRAYCEAALKYHGEFARFE